jgi:hypothetical protein
MSTPRSVLLPATLNVRKSARETDPRSRNPYRRRIRLVLLDAFDTLVRPKASLRGVARALGSSARAQVAC